MSEDGPRHERNFLFVMFCGMCMGAADLVPGISGGTIAFIMGFYKELLTSIKSFRIRSIFSSTTTRFLGSLLSGIFLSLILLAPFFDRILNHEVYRTYLYSSFFGLIAASIVLSFKQIEKWQFNLKATLVIGMITAFMLTSIDLKPLNNEALPALIDPWLMFCGSIAVCALLLPGISGSYLLTILGSYSIVISALADLIESAKKGLFDASSFIILLNLSGGILFGAIIFSRVVLWLLNHYRNLTISLMTGFMIGALPTVWPFWSYSFFTHPLKPEKGLLLRTEAPILPAFSELMLPILLALLGFGLVFFVERQAKLKAIKHIA